MTRGKFITFEGIEGVGKTTQASRFRKALYVAGIEYVGTREPNGSIRKLFLERDWDGIAETFLLLANRRDHVYHLIEPALAMGEWVVSDRFAVTTFAYQGHGRGVPLILLHEMNRLATNGLEPDLTFILDLPVEVGLERVRCRSEPDRVERLGITFFNMVRVGFRSIAAMNTDRCVLLDATADRDVIHRQVIETVNDRFGVTL